MLEETASDKPAPGGGSIAAVVVAMAAALVEKTAVLSRDWGDASGAVAQARKLRTRAVPLAEEDAIAYGDVIAAMRSTRDKPVEVRDHELGQALSLAAEVPLLIAETAADVAELAATAAERGNPNLRGDAATAAMLAAAAARSAANLVEINLGTTPDDERVERAARASKAASASADRAR